MNRHNTLFNHPLFNRPHQHRGFLGKRHTSAVSRDLLLRPAVAFAITTLCTFFSTWVIPTTALAQAAEATNAAASRNSQSSLSRMGSLYQKHCAVCHGEQMQGAPQGKPLVGVPLVKGEDTSSLIKSISAGDPDLGMPAWASVLEAQEIKSLALWISEARQGLSYATFNYAEALTYSSEPTTTELEEYVIYPIAEGLDPLPYSIAPLPNGDILVTEKTRGLRIVRPNGTISDLIRGTPEVFAETRKSRIGLEYGSGWLLDVAIHPEYSENGWVYLHHTDRCADCNEITKRFKRGSMNRVVRGRIKDGEWLDEEVIWQADASAYSPSSDVAAGGRLAFDPDGFLYVSIGMQSREGLQNLSSPHGKILRLHDDGRIPADNPFVETPNALPEIWSYGHRSPQGLEFEASTGLLWGTEHGPRGGDEVNLLLPGRNYGWPLFSKGQNYDGSEVAWGRETSEVTLKDIEQPIVDMTPSPAVSSFVFYTGNTFPAWQGDMLVGSLKAMDLFRIRISKSPNNTHIVEQELIVRDLARIRDIEVASNGDVILLLEHAGGGQIARMTKAPTTDQTSTATPK